MPTPSRGSTRVAEALRLADCGSSPAAVPGSTPAAARGVLVDGTDVGTSVRSRRARPRSTASRRRRRRRSSSTSTRSSPATRRELARAAGSRFPASSIDLAFVLADDVPAGDVLATLRDAGGDLLESVALFDVFRSDALGAGRVSLAFALRFRAPDRTLTDAEVGELPPAASTRCVAAHGAELPRDAASDAFVAPHPRALRRGRRAGRGVQRGLAHVLRRFVHAVHGVARASGPASGSTSSTSCS